jgi:D-alanine-D-alanine ligase
MKIKVGFFFGGKSVEHEVAVITANQAYESINKEKYEVVPIYISKKGIMYTGEDLFKLSEYKDMDKLLSKCIKVTLINDGESVKLIRYPFKKFKDNVIDTIDIAFPIMHGTNGEDGTIQGYLELLGIPYIGCDILSSSIGMDKIIMKKVLRESGLPVVDFVSFYSLDYMKNEKEHIAMIEEKLKYPLIVKPGNLGSSVGIKKAKDTKALEEAIEFAMQFSDRIIVENAISNLKEINCSVLGDMINCKPSVCEEPISTDEILSYKDKYVGGGKTKGAPLKGQKGMAAAKRKIPAELSKEKTQEVEMLATEVFKTLGASGVSRIDFLIDKDTDKVYVNEINTIPGALSYYLWEATGESFEKEIEELIEVAFQRQRQREKTVYSYDQNILALSGAKIGTKSK